MDKDEIPPGDSVGLEITFSTSAYEGWQTKQPLIITNEDTSGAGRVVRLSANVFSQPDSTFPVVITPCFLNMTQYGDQLNDSVNFEIENVSDQYLYLTPVDVPDGLFSMKLPRSIGAHQTGHGFIKLKPEAFGEAFEKSMTIELSDPDHTRFTIPIRRMIYNSPE